MLNNNRVFFGVYLSVIFGIFYFSLFGFCARATSPDALAIRVIPNSKHYSPIRWYQSQGFSGSPQSVTIDGYDAVRDGRTVYVNVANIANNRLYTNIYLISYNQSAENKTIDIFGQVLEHWKFNTNIQGTGSCSQTTDRSCLTSAECNAGEYCTSPKAKITRDTKRLSDLADLSTMIEAYRSASGYYPKISSGSYLSNKTISTWPSWQEELGAALGKKLPVDPINKLGVCPENFDPTTCWDQNEKKFGGAVDTTKTPALIGLPDNSNVYTYSASADGSKYSLTLGTESGTVGADGSFDYGGSGTAQVGTTGSSGSTGNGAPTINCGSLVAFSSDQFSGFISATDPENNKLKFTLDTSISNWSNWSAPPVLQDTDLANQKKIWAAKTGPDVSYTVRVSVSDDRGAMTTKDCKISIVSYCGDGFVQRPNTKKTGGRNNNGYEDCEPGNPDSYAANPAQSLETTTVNGDIRHKEYSCVGACQKEASDCGSGTCTFAGGYCGDSVLQSNYGEQCDFGPIKDNGSTQVSFIPDANSQSHQYACTSECAWTGGYCGDSFVQANYGEKCDTKGGNGTSANDQYACSQTCSWTGGWYGNGIVDPGHEDCDPSISSVAEKCNFLKSKGINDSDGTSLDCTSTGSNIIGDTGISNLYTSICDNGQAKCLSAGKKEYLGLGCYQGQTDPNNPSTGTGCQKGIYVCDNDNITCDVGALSPAKWDYCCANNANAIKTGSVGSFTIVRASAADLTVPSFGCVYSYGGNNYCGSGYSTFNYYTCDNVCKRVGKICIGVGLNSSASNACISVVHDVGGTCSCANSVNQYRDDCRSKYSLAGASTATAVATCGGSNCVAGYLGTCTECPAVSGLSQYFHVGETACYCQ